MLKLKVEEPKGVIENKYDLVVNWVSVQKTKDIESNSEKRWSCQERRICWGNVGKGICIWKKLSCQRMRL